MLARYEPRGLLALDQRAFGMVIVPAPEPPKNEDHGGAQVVTIRGPLMHHADPLCDNYDAIRARVVEALSKGPKALVLRIDSPGGLVAGCFELANDIQRLAAVAKVPVLAYVEGQACSAAYALACAAERIVMPATAAVGSIGIVDAIVDATKADAAMGLRFTLVASGARKTDGNPHAETSVEAVKASKARVDTLAEVFFDFVAQARGVDEGKVRALEAGVVHGVDAEKLGLANAVGSFDQLLASVASASENRPAAAAGNEEAMNEDEKARAALKAIIDDEKSDEKAKARAKRALAAMDESDAEDDEKAKAARAQAEEDEKAKAAKAAKADADQKDEEARAAATAAKAEGEEDAKATALRAVREIHTLRAERAAEKEALERKELLATRPDFAPDVVAFLGKASIEQVRDAVKSFPRVPTRAPFANPFAAATTPAATRGEGQVDAPGSAPNHELDVKMGLARASSAIVHDGNALKLGVMTRAESIALQKSRAEAASKAASTAR